MEEGFGLRKRILIVDDDEKFQVLIREFLETDNAYDLLILSDGREILSHVHRFKPDLILLDLLMPDIGGIEVCQILNEDPLASTIPILVISSLEKDTDKLYAYKQGVVGFLVKPSNKDELLRAVQKALNYKENK